jgi:hypothetical protein
MMCSHGRSWAEEGASEGVTSEWHPVQMNSEQDLAGVIKMTGQTIQGGSRKVCEVSTKNHTTVQSYKRAGSKSRAT